MEKGRIPTQQELFLKAISDNESTRRKGVEKGPATSDGEFFTQALSPSLNQIRQATSDGDFRSARTLFASYIRSFLDTDKFFTIPYETPENVYKLPGESDSEACKRIEDYKVVSVGVPGDFSKERRIGWFANPTYNGYREWTWQLSRHNEIKMMAHEYNITHDERIAAAACDIMRSWLEDAISPVPGTIGYATECWRTIECGIRMGANWPYILFSFIKSPHFDDDLVVDWFKSVYEHALRLTEDRTSGNWLIMEMNGLAHIAILFPFFKDSRKWFDDAVSTLEGELDAQFYPDGFQYELTTNYHDVVVNNYQRLFETARAFSVPLPQSLHDKLLKACDLYVKLMMCDGTTPDINDGRRASVAELLEVKSRFFTDRDIRFVTQGGEEPDYTSTVLEYSGFAVFRTGWKNDDVWALLDAAPFGKAHQHEDKLNFLMFANGRMLLCEGGNYAYDESEMRKYILSTRSHNTARVDGHDQNRKADYHWHSEDIGKLSGINSNIPDRDIEWAQGCYDEGYENVDDPLLSHTRRVVFLRNERVFVLKDSFRAQKEHDYEILFHIDDRRIGPLEYESLRFIIPDASCSVTTVTGQMEPEVQGFIALSQEQGHYKAVDCLKIGIHGQNASVVTLIQCKDGKGKNVTGVDTAGDGSSITIHFDGSSRLVPLI